MKAPAVLKRHSTKGVRQACLDLWTEVKIQHRHFSSVRKAKQLQNTADLKLHLGCGPCIKPGWVNVDVFAAQADLQLDLRERFPFPAACACFVFSEHFFEHLEYPNPAVDPTYFNLARVRHHPAWCNTRMHNLNYHFRQGREHKYAYDLETLKQVLESVGFISVERRPFVPGLDSDARRVDFLPSKSEGLYVNALKPKVT